MDTVLTASGGLVFGKRDRPGAIGANFGKSIFNNTNYNEVKQLAYSTDAKEARKLSAF